MTGRHVRFLPYDIAVIAVRCIGTGTLIGLAAALELFMVDDSDLVWSYFWPLVTAAVALFATGTCVGKYIGSAVRYSKMLEGDSWLDEVKRYRVDRLTAREAELELRLAILRSDFAAEKAALEEVREERIAQERMAGFVEGLSKSPSVMAFLANPRNRLRVVPDPDEESA
jgi:hypothetical protein